MPIVAAGALALLIGVLAVPGGSSGTNRPEVPSGAWMAVSGTVVSIDPRHDRLVLWHGPLETAQGGMVACALVDARFLARLRRGDRIDALARTDRHPWLLRAARILWEPPADDAPIAAGPLAPVASRT